jgi:hypothetical protein
VLFSIWADFHFANRSSLARNSLSADSTLPVLRASGQRAFQIKYPPGKVKYSVPAAAALVAVTIQALLSKK